MDAKKLLQVPLGAAAPPLSYNRRRPSHRPRLDFLGAVSVSDM